MKYVNILLELQRMHYHDFLRRLPGVHIRTHQHVTDTCYVTVCPSPQIASDLATYCEVEQPLIVFCVQTWQRRYKEDKGNICSVDTEINGSVEATKTAKNQNPITHYGRTDTT